MNKDLRSILNYLKKNRGLDFSGYRASMIERRIKKRLWATKTSDYQEYFGFVQKQPHELTHLIDVLTINVSGFFRDPLTFEYIAHRILPAIVFHKSEGPDQSLRIWSAGCATGEEPYSIAILIKELFEKEDQIFDINIFATDIDGKTLGKAQEAVYPFESLKNVKYSLLKKYFIAQGKSFKLIPEVTEYVMFIPYDMLDQGSYAPPESVFGGFDMVLCRNLLIYFSAQHQDLIFEKLYRSLDREGYLILGEAETLSIKYQSRFSRVNEYCHIYQKR